MNNTISTQFQKPLAVKIIALLMLLTIFRAQTILFIPELELYGGIAPNGWYGPWASDFIIGLLVPLMVFLALKTRHANVWPILILYNGLGAFDYSQGLITQWLSPMPAEMASEATVYAGIGVFMVFQLIALGLLFRKDVANHFLASN